MSERRDIDGAQYLLRRVPPRPNYLERAADGSICVSGEVFATGGRRASADGQRRELSVSVRNFLDDPKDPLSALGDRVAHGLIEFAALIPRSLGLDVEHAPQPEHFAHANVIDWPDEKAARKRLQVELAKSPWVWIRQPAADPPSAA